MLPKEALFLLYIVLNIWTIMCLSSLPLNYSKGEGKCARVGWAGVKSAYPDLMALSEGIQFFFPVFCHC